MPTSPSPPPLPVSTDVVAIEQSLTRITYLAGRARQHERLMALAGLPLDRAAVAILRHLAEDEMLRPGVLAVRLSVEASHVTRQLRHLEQAGYVSRVPDPEDRRAQLIHLTDSGRTAVHRIREAGLRGMQAALTDWEPEDLHHLASLFERLVRDFVTHAEAPVEGD
ncbi:MarR family winged helix-turn-helix transcriptional regulator [Streptomyces sp. NBC_00582]|uniref:MarR family winged helix-turn-helix transcriptional regulator n=1 Tax=Streptomyces sp. NBC_00582 TaxID=2975783 RepID=UPI00106274CA|nr:MarR family transcriptional regulator [Streptomyces sp. NBC_00582]WUB63167.1 MarR family transcriptional regulator [Streptomyces sp. NBC_00582]